MKINPIQKQEKYWGKIPGYCLGTLTGTEKRGGGCQGEKGGGGGTGKARSWTTQQQTADFSGILGGKKKGEKVVEERKNVVVEKTGQKRGMKKT